ncbi:MAG TPA: EamA family transporter, partial [Acidimicrobiales bacterium]|nr:EamA family transporter [Acidimicrobiales bacterium]
MSVPAEADRRPPWLAWAALGTIYFVWGTTYLSIRVGVRELPPLLFAGFRFIVAGLLLYPIARRLATSEARTLGSPSRLGLRAWVAAAAVGILLPAGGNGTVTFAETRIASGLAAVLIATVPLWIVVFARVLRAQPITRRAMLGLLIGIGGVAILTGGGQTSGHLGYVVLTLGAAASWAFGSVLGHELPLPRQILLAASMEMLVGGATLVILGTATGEFAHVRLSAVPTTSWVALAYLIGPGSILAYSAYGYALSHLRVTTVATYAYVNPVVALIAGIVLLG